MCRRTCREQSPCTPRSSCSISNLLKSQGRPSPNSKKRSIIWYCLLWEPAVEETPAHRGPSLPRSSCSITSTRVWTIFKSTTMHSCCTKNSCESWWTINSKDTVILNVLPWANTYFLFQILFKVLFKSSFALQIFPCSSIAWKNSALPFDFIKQCFNISSILEWTV